MDNELIKNKLNEGRKKIAFLKLKEDAKNLAGDIKYNTINVDISDKIERFEIFICVDKSIQDDVINILDKLEIKGVREKHNEFGVSVLVDKDTHLKEVVNTYKKIKNIFNNVLCFVNFEKQGNVIMKDYLNNLIKYSDK